MQDNIPALISRLENSQKQNEETTKTLINQLAVSGKDNQDQINKSLIDTMQNMKGVFEEITQNLKEGMTQTLSDSSKELKDLLLNVSEKINVLLKQTEGSRMSFQKDIDQTASKLHAFTDRLDKVIFELSNTTTPKIQSAVKTFNEAAEQQKQIAEKNEQYIRSLDSLSGELKDMSLSVSNAIQELPGFIEDTKQSNESLQEVWSNYEKRFSNVDESARKLFESISEGLASVSKGSAEYINNLYKQSSQVSSNFSQAVEELQEGISKLNEVVNKLKE